MKYKLNIPLQIHLGVPDTERAQEQKIWVRVEFEADTGKAEQTDNIEDCPIDYQEMYDLIHTIADQEFHLIESLHYQISTQLEQAFPKAQDLQVSIIKDPWEGGFVEISAD